VDDPDDYFATTDPLYWVQLFPSREEFVKRYREVRAATKARLLTRSGPNRLDKLVYRGFIRPSL